MRSIWAVTINTIKQAFRLKIAFVFALLLIILLPVMGFVMTGDGTIKGRLQTFVSYSLSLTSLLLCLLTIIISIYSITDDIKQKRVYTVLTKPIHRYKLLLGKFIGVVLLDILLLLPCAAIIYGITVKTPMFLNATEDDLIKLNNEFFTCRAAVFPPEIDVKEQAQIRYEELRKKQQLPEEMTYGQILQEITYQKKREMSAVDVGRELVWKFNNIRPLDANQSLFIRFKYDVSVNPPDLNVYSRWVVGDLRQIKFGEEIKTQIYTIDRKDIVRTFHEIEVPGDAVAEDGYLEVAFVNVPLNNTAVIFPPEEGLEILYKVDTFTANFIRAVLLILFRLIFLTCIGIFTSSFLSFPVAILLALSVFFIASMSSFIIDSFDFIRPDIGIFYLYTVNPLLKLIPQFDRFNPSDFLVPARQLSWLLVLKVAAVMVCIKALLALLLALLIFSKREIAKIII